MTLAFSPLTRFFLFLALLAATVCPAAAQPDPTAEARVAAALAEAHGEAVPAGLARAVAGTLSQEQKLNASNGASGEQFGYSVAIDGDRALIGSSLDLAQAGSAFVFEFDGTQPPGSQWTQTAKLTASAPGSGDQFGYSVSLSGDRALVGAPFRGLSDDGAAYVFAFDGSQWVQQQRLTASDFGFSIRSEFGFSVALEGDHALVGAPEDGQLDSGAAYFFAFDGSQPPGQQWTPRQRIGDPEPAAGECFGISVSLSGDRALVGDSKENSGGITRAGAAYVFDFDGTQPPGSQWAQTATLTASDPGGNHGFGYSVSLSGDRALVGAPGGDADASPGAGAAYVFELTTCGAGCYETAKLTASDAALGDQFGWSVSLSGDRALVGAIFDDGGSNTNGSAYAFSFDGSQPPGQRWTEDQKFRADDAGDDRFGWSVALSGDRALVGAVIGICVEGGGGCGTAYVFGPAPPLDVSARNTTPRRVAPGRSVGFAYTLDNNTAAPASGQLWFNARTSGGATVAQAVIVSGTLPAGASQSGSYTQPIPGNAPAGAYTYCLRLGVFPNTVVDEACFTLTVTGTARAAGPAAWSVRDVTPWEHKHEDAPQTSSTTGLPASLALEAAYPNPFAEQAVIGYAVPEAADVRLVVYDLLGRTVAVLADGRVEAGRYEAVLDGAALPSGTYLVRLDAGGAVQTQRLTLVR